MNRRPIVTFSTHALVEVLRALQPDFEAEQDCRLAFAFDPSQAIRRRVAEGEAFDIVVGTREMIDALAAEGWVAPETRATIGRTGLGISVRAGAARPDLGSVEAFKRALLTAKSVVRSREGASGSAFADVLERLGIADAMRDKVIVAGSGRVAEYAARGEAEMAVQQISELVPVQGADFVGPFPPELQRETVFAAAVSSASEARAAAEAFVALLTAPVSAPVFRANGLAPA
ncbi:MAG TPA: substrate-binding domain-containing protein, partial [Pseudolabrys sp.]|nr:substrate-binding domain-containing protein [Pseudolabrys sp.]